ncbi:MAG TPA: preprotein translocase subunit SecG [Pseudomonadales bacterium]|jgi:preprotein translocase subunit SecG|nr:preprotein translocase subunit SecG [Pseudomonadales bacterium]MDP7313313.1 preprotein translocase subunit SecG [Pseudomonadales bacterium]MDP7576257.1 preprotein translocase subunit SecG [Pseudomonadales bacterium]HJL61341.1 preprotein translocase subunit SecG [Pseudomonadales bacterium]|tara:strand:- start:143 stop:544 length:402 start_codon:yes stop_codon:yes gene_type:complete
MDPQVLETLALIVHVLASLGIIGLVLLQHGKGAEMGSGFGGGSSGTVFGSGGAGNFLTKATTYIAVAFFLTSFALAYFAKQKSVAARELGIPAVVEQVPVEAGIELPALDGAKGEDDSELPNVDEADSEIPEA